MIHSGSSLNSFLKQTFWNFFRCRIGIVRLHNTHSNQLCLITPGLYSGSQGDQLIDCLRITQGNQYPLLLVITITDPVTAHFRQGYILSRTLGNKRSDRTSNQNHNDSSVQDVFIQQSNRLPIRSGTQNHLIPDQYGSQRSRSLGITQSENQTSLIAGQFKIFLRYPSCHKLG